MEGQQLDAALQAEYLHLQKTIEDFDSRALTIKAWSVSFGLAAIGGAFASHASAVFLIAAAGASLFWYLETTWKVFQMAYYSRSEAIERHFRTNEKLSAPFQIAASWHRSWRRTSPAEVRWVAIWPHVALPHAFVLGLGLLLFVLACVGTIKP
jgi:hypothetical protein